MTGRRAELHAAGPGAVAAGRIDGPVTTHVTVFGTVSIPLEVARLDPAGVFADAGVDGFTGRQWLTDALDDFLTTRPSGYVWLEADAGLGKTAYAAWLVRHRGYCGHFSRQSSAGAEGARQNLAAQLITDCGLTDLAPGGMLPHWATTPEGFNSLLHRAAAHNRGRLVLVIDGLDEIAPGPAPDRPPLGLPPTLPPGVFVIGTYRTGYHPGGAAGEVRRLRITPDDPRNQADLSAYLQTATRQEPLATRLAAHGLDADTFRREAIRRCGGIWVYLRYLLHEIRLGLRPADTWDDLPGSLWEYYLRQLTRWQAHPDWPRLGPVLATLAAVPEPVDLPMLARLAAVDDPTPLRDYRDRLLRPFLAVEPGPARRASIYHTSFRQFLTGEPVPGHDDHHDHATALAEQLREAVTAAHTRIADHYLDRFGGLDTGLKQLADQPALAATDGGYPLRHLARHLHQAGRTDDLHRLLTCSHPSGPDRESNVWHQAHHHADTIDAYLRDLDLARRTAEATTDAQIAAGQPPHGLVREVLYALLTASVHTTTDNVHPELIAALAAAGVWDHTRALNHARRITDPQRRATALTLLAPHLPHDQQPAALDQALRAATAISVEYRRADALAALAPYLSTTQLTQALDAATAITDEHHRVQALIGLAPHLSPDQLTRALQVATRLTTWYGRRDALVGLAPYLPADRLSAAYREALPATDATTAQYHWVRALSGLVPEVPEDGKPAAVGFALQAAAAIADERDRAQAITRLIPYLTTEEHLAYALDASAGITDPYAAAQVLTALAPRLPADQRPAVLDRALQAAARINEQNTRGQALIALAPHLSGEQLARALDAAIAISHDHFRARALAGLAPHLGPDLLVPALRAATAIASRFDRAQAFASLAPHLPPEQRPAVLEPALHAATTIGDWRSRARALAELASYLDGDRRSELFTHAVAAIREIDDEDARSRALVWLAPRLPVEHLAQALEVALGLSGEPARAHALAGLAPHLSEEQRDRARRAATAMSGRLDRGWALVGLLPHLPADQRAAVRDQAYDAVNASVHTLFGPPLLTSLAPHLSEAQRARALEVATTLTDPYGRAEALTGLAPYLDSAQLDRALAAVPGTDSAALPRALTGLAPYLSPDQMRRALALAIGVTDEYPRALALSGLAPYLPADQLDLAHQAAVALTHPEARAAALVGVAPHLPADQRPAALAGALEAATAVPAAYARARLLTALVPHVAAEQRTAVLESALQALSLADEYVRGELLPRLAPYLTTVDQLRRVLADGDRRNDPAMRAVLSRLRELEPSLTGDTLPVVRLALDQKSRPACLTAIAKAAAFLVDSDRAIVAGFVDAIRRTIAWWP